MKAIGGADKFVKTALDTGGAPGKTVTSVPLYGLAYGLYYNKKMFTDAGITPPTNWEDMVSDAKKLTTGGKYGFALAAGSYTENAHFAFINAAQNGAELFDKKGNPTFTSTANVDGIKRYLDLMQTDKVVNPSNAQYDNGVAGGQRLRQRQGRDDPQPEQRRLVDRRQRHEVRRSTASFRSRPRPAASTIASHVAGINLSIFKNTKNKDAALKFVKYMTSEATQTTLGKPYVALPVLNGAKADFTDNAEEAADVPEDLQQRCRSRCRWFPPRTSSRTPSARR